MEHIGIDVHKRDSQIYSLAQGGEVVEQRIRTEPERFAAVLGSRPRARILIEASTESEWGARGLEALGHEVIVADPNFAPHVGHPLPHGQDRPARCPRPGRGLPARRLPPRPSSLRFPAPRAGPLARPGRPRPDAHALHLRHPGPAPSAGLPAARRTLSSASRACPGPAACSRWSRRCLPSCPLNRQLAYSDERIEPRAVQDPRVPRLRSVPGVGPVTAAAFLAAIDDVGRFHAAHQREADLGLGPREYSSGETPRRGPIPKAGHSRTRWLLIQAAVSLLRRHPPQAEERRTWALRIAARRGKQVPVVALARRLAGILYALLRDRSVFEPPHVRPPRPTAAAALVNA